MKAKSKHTKTVTESTLERCDAQCARGVMLEAGTLRAPFPLANVFCDEKFKSPKACGSEGALRETALLRAPKHGSGSGRCFPALATWRIYFKGKGKLAFRIRGQVYVSKRPGNFKVYVEQPGFPVQMLSSGFESIAQKPAAVWELAQYCCDFHWQASLYLYVRHYIAEVQMSRILLHGQGVIPMFHGICFTQTRARVGDRTIATRMLCEHFKTRPIPRVSLRSSCTSTPVVLKMLSRQSLARKKGKTRIVFPSGVGRGALI